MKANKKKKNVVKRFEKKKNHKYEIIFCSGKKLNNIFTYIIFLSMCFLKDKTKNHDHLFF